jgi:hypothetical protein
MARKTVRMSAEQQRDVTIRVDFYRCTEREDKVLLGHTLEKARLLAKNSRTLTVDKENIILCELSCADGIYEGEIARLRMTETPAIGSLSGEIAELRLDADQGLAERTAFLFDTANQILAIHSVREAVSPGRLAGFCDVVEASTDGFIFEPVLRTDTLSDFNHLEAIRKVEVKIARVGLAAKAPSPAISSVKEYLKLNEVAGLEAETMTITLGMGHERRRGMVMDSTRSFIRGLLDHKDELSVETLIVSGKEAGDEAVVLDLLRGRVRSEVVIEVRGRTASYNQRQDAVKRAYKENYSLFANSTS